MAVKRVATSEALQEFGERKKAYLIAFGGPSGKIVMEHWAAFCRANSTTIVIGDSYLTHVFEGRRQAYLLARDYLDLTVEELVEKYAVAERPA